MSVRLVNIGPGWVYHICVVTPIIIVSIIIIIIIIIIVIIIVSIYSFLSAGEHDFCLYYIFTFNSFQVYNVVETLTIVFLIGCIKKQWYYSRKIYILYNQKNCWQLKVNWSISLLYASAGQYKMVAILQLTFSNQFMPIFSVPLFPNISELSTHGLPLDYLVHISQVSPQLSCEDTRRIWTWFERSNLQF